MFATTKPKKEPMILTIVGDGGIGKTSLACEFDAPIIFPVENPGNSLARYADKIEVAPSIKYHTELYEMLKMLLNEEHNFKTVIIDSITRLNRLIEGEVLYENANKDKDGNVIKRVPMNQLLGGFGAGNTEVASRHYKISEMCKLLSRRKNMNIIYIAHCSIETITPPDSEPYNTYSIPMHEKSLPCYTSDVDMVAFLKLEKFIVDDGSEKRKIAQSSGSRVITAYKTANHISKNRYDIVSDIRYDQGKNPFAQYL